MFRVTAKTKDGKRLAGPSGAESFEDAMAETTKAAKAANKQLLQVSIKVTDGVGPGIRLAEPRKRKGK